MLTVTLSLSVLGHDTDMFDFSEIDEPQEDVESEGNDKVNINIDFQTKYETQKGHIWTGIGEMN